MKKRFWDYFLLFGITIIIIILDQWTKSLVRTHIAVNYGVWSPWPWLTPYARIINITNTGAAFGIFQGFGNIFTLLAIVVVLAITYYFPKVPREDWPLRVARGLQLGGALGNLIDRLYQGHVTDFVSLGRFAVFNVADASISTGVAVLLIGVWFKERQEKREQEKAAAENSEASLTPPKNEAGGEEINGE